MVTEHHAKHREQRCAPALAVAVLSNMPSQGEGGRGAALALPAPAEPLLVRAAGPGVGEGSPRHRRQRVQTAPRRLSSAFRSSARRVAGKGLGQRRKESDSCRGTGLGRRGRNSEGQAVGLEPRAVVGGFHGSRVWQLLLCPYVVRAPACSMGKAAWRAGVGGGVENLQESFSRGSD